MLDIRSFYSHGFCSFLDGGFDDKLSLQSTETAERCKRGEIGVTAGYTGFDIGDVIGVSGVKEKVKKGTNP